MHNIDLKYYTSVITKQIFISGKNFNLVVKPNVLGPAFAAEFPGYCVVLIYICIFLPAPPPISHIQLVQDFCLHTMCWAVNCDNEI